MMFLEYFKLRKVTLKFVICLLSVFVVLNHIDIYLNNKLQTRFRHYPNSDGNANAFFHVQSRVALNKSSRNDSEPENFSYNGRASLESWNPESSKPRSTNGTMKNNNQNNTIYILERETRKHLKKVNGNYASVEEAGNMVNDNKLKNYRITYRNWNRTHKCLIPSGRSMLTPIEDLFCLKMPNVLHNFKNPCWYTMSPDNEQPTLRCLPYFHVFGVCKSGTSDLFLRLLNHPQIVPSRGEMNKETWYWTWKRYGVSGRMHRQDQIINLDDYLDLFNTTNIQSRIMKLDGGDIYFPLVTGHGDPMDFWDHTMWKLIPQNNYLADEPDVLAPDLIRHINPNVKLILMLRNPIERLYSHYLHGKYGETAITFHLDVVHSVQAMRSCLSQHNVRACLYNERFINSLKAPLSASMYVVHLREWLRVFPRHQIFILRFEGYVRDMESSLRNLFKFLQLDEIPDEKIQKIMALPRFYKTKKKDTAGHICRETERILRDFFHPYTRDLVTLLNDSQYHAWGDLSIGRGCI